MKMQKITSNKTYNQHLQDLKAGKAVRAVDLCAAMGIETFVVK